MLECFTNTNYIQINIFGLQVLYLPSIPHYPTCCFHGHPFSTFHLSSITTVICLLELFYTL